MTTFLAPARGGIQPINGKAGAISAESAAADKGKPGRETIIHELNRIAEAARIQMLMSNCDPQSQLQKVQQQVQRQVQQVIEQRIGEIIQQEVSTNQDLKSIQERLQSIQQQAQSQGLNQSLQQQAEIANKELQSQISKVIVGAIGKASQQMSQAAKIANSVSTGLKPVAAVADEIVLAIRIAQMQQISASFAAAKIKAKTVQTVSQYCFF